MGRTASDKDVGPVERTGLVVLEPLLETLLVEDMSALLDCAKATLLGELGQTDGALHIEHILLEVQTIDEGVVPAHRWRVPVGHAFGYEYEHASQGKPHDGIHVNQVVDVAVGRLQLAHLRVVLIQKQFLVLWLVVGHSLADEDGHEDGEEDEEGRQHLMVKLLELQQRGNSHSQEDVDVEEKLKFDDVQLLQLCPVFENQRVYLVTTEDQHSVDCQHDKKFKHHQYYILPENSNAISGPRQRRKLLPPNQPPLYPHVTPPYHISLSLTSEGKGLAAAHALTRDQY